MLPPGVLVILGPTASGKSALALRLARWWRGRGRAAEIINADAMLVYRGLDIGTAKPTVAERRQIPHHLIDCCDLDQPFSVAQFQALARQAIAGCRRRGVQPIVVGGSALYLRAIVDRFDFPPLNPGLRASLEAELATVGPGPLHDRLRAIDPAAAAGILPGNGRRTVRALEVIATTGCFRSRLPAPEYALEPVVQIGLDLSRDRLDQRIGQRVEAMWAAGLVGEVAGLMRHGLREAPTASRAIGYRQVMDFLDAKADEAATKELIALRTRQFVRKQLAWWRRDRRIRWWSAEPAPDPGEMAASLPWQV
ncbi:MAG: tRNA (adenosine(37)-N6)-dimethylallyltransferase MiaA [Propionibacteriaceae bacterium]|nr:tRNA (adenosine(37)-N6)-dimethylallyltransferase MiaA [Propionibacteriaceae bacterium]